jgi:hypothetical protein
MINKTEPARQAASFLKNISKPSTLSIHEQKIFLQTSIITGTGYSGRLILLKNFKGISKG